MSCGTAGSNPERLFDLCLDLVAENLDMVDSFQGFPSLVGEKIFQRAMTSQRIRDVGYASQAVQLFAEAFGREFLATLNVAGQHLGVNYYLDQIFTFTDLVDFDVSGCGLGDNHEILAHISKLTSLEVLHLRNNHISDRGVQKLTLAYRMFGRGPHGLSQLDLSGNSDLTEGCLKYVSPFTKLAQVTLFGCSKFKAGSYKDWTVREDSSCKVPAIHTSGWASRLVTSWMKEAEDKARNQPSKKKSFFYSKPTIASGDNLPGVDIEGEMKTFLVACRCLNKPDIGDYTRAVEALPQSSTEEDNDLMNLYMKPEQDAESVKKKTNLLTGLTKSDDKTILSYELPRAYQNQKLSKKVIFSKHKVDLCTKDGSKGISKASGLNHKAVLTENSEAAAAQNKQPSILKYCNLEDKLKSDKAKKPVLLQNLSRKHGTCTDSKDRNVKGDRHLLVREKTELKSFQVANKRSHHGEEGSSVVDTNIHVNGPKKKKRKIVIVKSQCEVTSANMVPAIQDGEKKCRKAISDNSSNPKSSLFDGLNKWI